MPEKINQPKLPRGLARLAFRFPIFLYRIGLGWLFGYGLLCLTHIGRKSGLPRQTVLEVVHYDKTTGECIVASGWNERSDWYLNVMKNPGVTVQIGRKRFKAVAGRLSPEQGGKVMLARAREYPFPQFVDWLARFMGYRLDGTQADIQAMGELIPMFVLTPVEKNPG